MSVYSSLNNFAKVTPLSAIDPPLSTQSPIVNNLRSLLAFAWFSLPINILSVSISSFLSSDTLYQLHRDPIGMQRDSRHYLCHLLASRSRIGRVRRFLVVLLPSPTAYAVRFREMRKYQKSYRLFCCPC